MREAKEIVTCVTPFIVAALMLFPFMAIVGASVDPFMWERTDRMFYAITTVIFGAMLLTRINYVRNWEGKP